MSAERKPVRASDSVLRDCLAARSSLLHSMAVELIERRAKDALVAELVASSVELQRIRENGASHVENEDAIRRHNAAIAALRGKDGA